jgi:hypothetical protein
LRGAFEHRKPHPLFDPVFYLQKYPEVSRTGANPLAHYLRRANSELRQPTPFFHPEYYLQHNPDVRKSGIPPLLHYVRHGVEEGRKPHPLFDPEYYRRCGFGIQISASQLLAHFAESGASAINPHPLFNCDSYLSKHPEAAAQGMNPLAHYLFWRGGKQTPRIPEFDGSAKHLEAAQLEIADMPVVIVFQGDGLPQEQNRRAPSTLKVREMRAGSLGSVVLVSKDNFGTVTIEAEPQQQPFFEAIPFEQLYAQVNTWLAVE